jgi:two-component system nitrate/nitrite response regulator NarL
MANDSALSVLIVSRHTLVREGLKALIADMPFGIIFERDSIRAAIAQAPSNIGLVLAGAPLRPDLVDTFKMLRATYPHARIVCYTSTINLPLETLNMVFPSTFDGCLLSSSPPQALRQSLDLIMMGESVIPFSLVAASASADIEPGQARHGVSEVARAFSDRELEILTILQDGKSNKAIARDLGLSEATIKVHIKNVLRKLGASNRTEAAIWITKNKKALLDKPVRRPLEESTAAESDFDALANEDL